MTTYLSTAKWKPIEFPILNALTTDIKELTRANWPIFTHSSTQFNRVFANSETQFSATCPSCGIVATLITERIDLKDDPYVYNYNSYLVSRTTDEKFFQSGPIITTNPKHHLSSPSTLFSSLEMPPL